MTLYDGPDCALNVEILGDGEPVTLFAHGITGSTDELAPFAARVRGTRVLLDLRGHGASGSPLDPAVYDHPALRRDVEWAVDRFGATRVVALSVAAGAVLNLLVDRPDRFDRLVLVTPASIGAPNAGADPLFIELADRLEQKPLDDVLAWSLDGSAELIRARPYWAQLIRERVARMNAEGMPRALRAYVTGRPPVGDAFALRAVRAPVLILAHEGDPIHDVAVAERLASLLPDARVVRWSEPLAMWDDQDALASLVAEFLDG